MSGFHLAFEVAENYFRVARLEQGQVSVLTERLFDGRKDYQYKEQLSKAIDDLVLNQEPDEITVVWVDRHATLVPATVFEPALTSAIFSASFNKKAIPSELDYNRLPVEGMVNIYEIPLWLKSFFVLRYPRVQISHLHTPIIKALTRLPGISAHVFCLVAPEQCYIWVSKQDQILFLNQYDIASEEDILYYLSFALQQLQELAPKGDLKIEFTGKLNPWSYSELIRLIGQVPVLKSFEIKEAGHLTFQAHQYCV